MNNKNYGFFYRRNNNAFSLVNVFRGITAFRREEKSNTPMLNSGPSNHLAL